MKILPYGVRRVSQIAAKVEAARIAAPAIVFAPRCIRCGAAAVFFLADANGLPLSPAKGGICLSCAPLQGRDETAPEMGNPAPLDAIEAAAQECDAQRASHAQNIEALRIERAELVEELAAMLAFISDSPYASNGPTNEDIEATGARLLELDEMLILDDERPFILGFDDLPAAYFAAQASMQEVALAA